MNKQEETKKKKPRAQKIKYNLGGFQFLRKNDVKKKAKQIKTEVELDKKITDPKVLKFLLDLFALHYDWISIKGCGVKDVFVTQSRGKFGKVLLFNIRRNDNTIENVSLNEALEGDTERIKIIHKFKELCKNEVAEHISAAKQIGIEKYTQLEPTEGCNFTVSYNEVPFHHLVQNFMQEFHIVPQTFLGNIGTEDNKKQQLEDALQQWKVYHYDRAKLHVSKVVKCPETDGFTDKKRKANFQEIDISSHKRLNILN